MAALAPAEVQDLKETFRVFSELSETLENSYVNLEDHIARLQLQLADAQAEHRKESNEKNLVADRLNTILNALPAGVVVLDPSGVVQDCNPAAVNLLEGPLRGESWLDVVNRAFDLQSTVQSDDSDVVSLKDGRYVTLATCPLGEDPGQVILLNDVTENKRLQDKLNHHQRLKAIGEMAAGIAHQIRTPLSSGILCCSQLKNPRIDETKRLALVEKVLNHMGDLEKVINNMLVFSRGGFAGNEQIDIDELVDEVINSIQPQINQSHTHISINYNAHLTQLVGNQAILASAIQNIFMNAIQAMGSDGNLEVTLQNNQSGTVELLIKDDGPGIPEDVQAEIFKPFFTTRSKGTGLGLAVVQAIARAHDGEVWLQHSSAEQGSAFILRLPAVVPTDY